MKSIAGLGEAEPEPSSVEVVLGEAEMLTVQGIRKRALRQQQNQNQVVWQWCKVGWHLATRFRRTDAGHGLSGVACQLLPPNQLCDTKCARRAAWHNHPNPFCGSLGDLTGD